MKRRFLKANKRQKIIIGITILFFLLGLLYTAIIPKELINEKLNTYITNLTEKKTPVESLIQRNFKNNVIENTSIYLLTMIYLFPINILIYGIKIGSIGISITSLISQYHFKSFLYFLPVILPSILNAFLLAISMYYSMSYFIIKIKYRKQVSKKRLKTSYLKVFLITTILQIVISIFDSYLSFYYFPIIH